MVTQTSNKVVPDAEQQPLLDNATSVGNGGWNDENCGAWGLEDDSILSTRFIPEPVLWRVCAALFSFLVLGMDVAAIGVLIPHLEAYYHISDTRVSLIFLIPLTGYMVASLLNNTIHSTLGRRGIAIIGCSCQLLFTVVAALHPPWTVILLVAAIAGFGIGLMDAGWCAWAGGMSNANTVSGFLHGSYSIGCTVGPYFAMYLLSEVGLPWYKFYYVMSCAGIVELITLTWAFRNDDGAQFQSEKSKYKPKDSNEATSSMKEVLKMKVLWIIALYFLAYVGAESAVAGWVSTFMIRVRLATPKIAGICTSSFWAGHSFGRLSLGLITDVVGERLSVVIYLLFAITFELLFCLATKDSVSILAITLLGFFLGPLYPTGIVMLTRHLPRVFHVSGVAAVAAVGQTGGAAFPFALGAMAQAWGIGMLQPFIFGLLLFVLASWLAVPRGPQKEKPQSAHGDAEISGLLQGHPEPRISY